MKSNLTVEQLAQLLENNLGIILSMRCKFCFSKNSSIRMEKRLQIILRK